jgi:K+-transporting ATPase ATPase A chain
MHSTDWLQFALFSGMLALITKPMGLYLMQVLDANGRTWLDPVVKPFEKITYKLLGVDSQREQGWKQYTFAMLAFSLVSVVFTYAILRLQDVLPWNPQGLPALSHHLAFNTAVSFTTNTNWQSYGGEATMSYFSQMVGLTFHNFVSAATGIAIAAALVRGIARSSVKTLGNFWVDLVRTTYYLLLPLCAVFAIFLVSQGMIQNFDAYTKAATLGRHGADHRAGPDGLAGRHQDARHERRRLHECQRRASLRKSDAAVELHPDALDLRDRQRIDLLPRPHGEEPGARLGRVGAMMVLLSAACSCCAHEAAGNPIHQQLGIAAAMATWRARKCASASSTPRFSPPSPPPPRAAR